MEHPQNELTAVEPGQLGVPVLPVEATAKPPWHPRVSGIAGFLCGPVAAALVAFINLRRLNERRRAFWTLILTIAGSAMFGLVIAKVPDYGVIALAKLIGNFVSPFLYPLLQWRPFEVWASRHPSATRDNGWRSSGWAILGLVAFFPIVVGAGLAFSQNEEAHNIQVGYEMPETANVGEAFVFTISVENTASYPQLLHSLDISTHFLEGIAINRTRPAFRKSEPNLLAPIESYIFLRNIPAQGKIEIDVEGRARKPGVFPLEVDVCIKTAFACSSFDLNTITVR